MMTMLMKMMIINAKRFTWSLDKGYHHIELMVYARQRVGDIFDSTGIQCKHCEEDLTDREEGDQSWGRLESDRSNSYCVNTETDERTVSLQSGGITDCYFVQF